MLSSRYPNLKPELTGLLVSPGKPTRQGRDKQLPWTPKRVWLGPEDSPARDASVAKPPSSSLPSRTSFVSIGL